MMIKEIIKAGKKVLVSRVMGPDGYCYYLCLMNYDTFGNWIVDGSYRQAQPITSLSEAIKQANEQLT